MENCGSIMVTAMLPLQGDPNTRKDDVVAVKVCILYTGLSTVTAHDATPLASSVNEMVADVDADDDVVFNTMVADGGT